MGRIFPVLALLGVAVAAAALLSGGSGADPSTPPAAPGQPRPFLGTAVVGSGGLAAAVDAYGNLVDLRLPGPAGEAQISNSFERQAAGTVPPDTGIVAAASAGRHEPLPLWRGKHQRQRYLAGTNVVRTTARVAGAWVRIEDAAGFPKPELSRRFAVLGSPGQTVRLRLGVNLDLAGDVAGDLLRSAPAGFAQRDGEREVRCASSPPPRRISLEHGDDSSATLGWRGGGLLRVDVTCSFAGPPAAAAPLARRAVGADRRWLAQALPLGAEAPAWARRMYARSLLVLRGLADRRSGAIAAGARDGWAFVWPRDAGAAVLALAASGYRHEARRAARFLADLDLGSGARFRGDGSAVTDDRALPGDSAGWVRVAAQAAGIERSLPQPSPWARRGDYGEREGDSGDYLANAIAAGVPAARIRRLFATDRGLVRIAHDPDSTLDSAAAWAVRPFARPPLFGEVRRTLEGLIDPRDRYGVVPSEDWPYEEAWTAPTAWSAWTFAALADRGEALRLTRMLRRASTRAGTLPERASADSGLPRSTTPLVWSHAFAVLTLRELYPRRGGAMRQAVGR
ncbi:MAG: hypothetical protein AABM29_09430 [Actinomycetota bacterium]